MKTNSITHWIIGVVIATLMAGCAAASAGSNSQSGTTPAATTTSSATLAAPTSASTGGTTVATLAPTSTSASATGEATAAPIATNNASGTSTPLMTTTPMLTPAASSAGGATASVLAAYEGLLEQIYSQVSPSVVTIETVQSAATPQGRSQGGAPGGARVLQGLGSGFVWDSNGHIVTNNHVVAGANVLEVVFADGTTVSAKVTGTDSQSDLAVLQVDTSAMPMQPLQIGDSSQLKVGQLAVAIGNPYGEQNTMTTGIISAVGRTLPAEIDPNGATYSIPDVIQTDAAINPGNSGGVLLNGSGQVVGVTSALESAGQASAGVGFAIPSNIVKKVVPELIQTGHVQHPWLGISGTSLTPEISQAMNLQAAQRGALVVEVLSGSPAEQAGLKPSTQTTQVFGTPAKVGGDVITAVDSQPVKTIEDLISYLARNTDVGQTVQLTVLRDGKQQTVSVKLGARPDNPGDTSANP